jgi:hypothetical protein
MIINLLAIMSGLATILVLLAGYLELSRFIGEKLYELTVLRDKKQAKADRLMGIYPKYVEPRRMPERLTRREWRRKLRLAETNFKPQEHKGCSCHRSS